MVCGPTAAGKSSLSDGLAEELSGAWGTEVPTIVVDSMQVYEQIPETTNQGRGRPAELVGIISVEDEWTVALHKERAEGLISGLGDGAPFVLDAGTGMYLNAIILGIPLAPKARESERREALRISEGSANPRRAARAEELKLLGAPERGSVWAGRPLYGASFVYLRPGRQELDLRIARRSEKISREGAHEGEALLKLNPNASVRQAVGPKEMMMLASGEIFGSEAQQRIAARTRRLARRQMRWFDKLMRTLPETTPKAVVESADDPTVSHTMHDIIRSWEE